MEWAAGIPVCGRNWETNPKSTKTPGENPDSWFIGCKQERSQLLPWNYSKHSAWSWEKSGCGSQGISPSPQTQSQGKADLKSNMNQSNPIFSIKKFPKNQQNIPEKIPTENLGSHCPNSIPRDGLEPRICCIPQHSSTPGIRCSTLPRNLPSRHAEKHTWNQGHSLFPLPEGVPGLPGWRQESFHSLLPAFPTGCSVFSRQCFSGEVQNEDWDEDSGCIWQERGGIGAD